MHTIQSWSINSSFSFTKPYFYFFFLQSFNSQAQTPMARQFTKEIPLPSWQQPENIDDNLRPARFITQLGTQVIIGNTIG
jgi:hypothetical protein